MGPLRFKKVNHSSLRTEEYSHQSETHSKMAAKMNINFSNRKAKIRVRSDAGKNAKMINIKFRSSLMSLVLFMTSSLSFAGFPVSAYLENKSNEVLTGYIWGVGKGLLVSNKYIRGTSHGPMFCPNKKFTSEPKAFDFLQMLDREISRTKPNINDDIEILIFQAMLNELKC